MVVMQRCCFEHRTVVVATRSLAAAPCMLVLVEFCGMARSLLVSPDNRLVRRPLQQHPLYLNCDGTYLVLE